MRTHILAAVMLGLGTVVFASAVKAGGVKKDLPMEVQAARDMVIQYLARIKGDKQAQVLWLEDKTLKEVFPNLTLFAVRYRQFPVAFAPPEGLSSSNVFVVPKGGKPEAITNSDSLPKFFAQQIQQNKVKVADEKTAAAYVRAWLILHQELVQDGFYAFEIVKAEAKKAATGAIKAQGLSMVTKGGNGKIEVEMTFGPKGELEAGQEHKIQAGPRPKCQATKLLDPDPIVRYMAESELLFLGLAARPYLLEQRDRARDPRLQQAIDRLLRKIEAAAW